MSQWRILFRDFIFECFKAVEAISRINKMERNEQKLSIRIAQNCLKCLKNEVLSFEIKLGSEWSLADDYDDLQRNLEK